jgi:small subunit ribosomal protein S20
MVRGSEHGERAGQRLKPDWYTRSSMANIKSQIKRNRQNERRHERNKAVRSSLKTDAKKVRSAITEGDADAARGRLNDVSRALDKAAGKGVMHKRAAARRKSRLARAVNASSVG